MKLEEYFDQEFICTPTPFDCDGYGEYHFRSVEHPSRYFRLYLTKVGDDFFMKADGDHLAHYDFLNAGCRDLFYIDIREHFETNCVTKDHDTVDPYPFSVKLPLDFKLTNENLKRSLLRGLNQELSNYLEEFTGVMT